MTKNENDIYGAVAVKFHSWGLSPILLEKYNAEKPENTNPKKPVLRGWQKKCRQLTALKTIEDITESNPRNNIGIGLGMQLIPDQQLAALDIDYEPIVPFIETVLGSKITCSKRGKKGKTIFVMADFKIKPTKINLADGTGPVFEFLANNNQTVMPPSIHPDTGKAYEYLDCKPLFEYQPQDLQKFTERHLKIIETVLKSENAPIIISGSGTHEATLKMAAQLVSAGSQKDEIAEYLSALFPLGYSGNSIKELPDMIDSALEKGYQEVSAAQSIDARVAKAIISDNNPIIYSKSGDFLKYDRGYWQELDKKSLLKQSINNLGKFYEGESVINLVKNVIKCMEIYIYEPNFGKRSSLICCKNGTIDITTGELQEHSPNHELRYQLDFEYDENASCPLYDELIRHTLSDDEKAINLFDEFAGYTLIPDNTRHKALYLIGEAGSGKSTLLQTVMSMHDKNAYSVTALTKIDSERHITNLADKLLCISPDIQPKDKAKAFGEGFIRITGGDRVTTRKLYKEVEGNVQTHVRFMGSMNKLPPQFMAAQDALRRRLIFLPCGSKIKKPDPELSDKLMQERAGILNRWIRALKRLNDRGHFDTPETSINMVDEYLNNQDVVQVFINKFVVESNTEFSSVDQLYGEYSDWATEDNEQRVSKSEFGRKLKEHGLKQSFKKLPRLGRKEPVNTRVYNVKLKYSINDGREHF